MAEKKMFEYDFVFFLTDIKSYQMLTSIGVLICIVGEIIRKLAILTASSNFNHLVRKLNQTLYYN